MMKQILCVVLLMFGLSVAWDPKPLECLACKTVATAVVDWVESNYTEVEIQTRLEALCKLVPATYQDVCDSYIELGVPQLIAYVEQYETPEKICQQLGLCTAEESIQANPMECTACRYLAAYIESFVAQNKTEVEIEMYMDKLCTLLGKSYEATCDAFVSVGVPKIVEELENLETVDQICTQLGLCDPQVAEVKANDLECTMCKYVAAAIEGWVEQNQTISEIEARLNMMCKLLGNKYANICDQYINAGVPLIIQYLEEYEDAEEVCLQLGMCSAVNVEANPLECTACSYIVSTVESWVANNYTEEEIEQKLESLCNIVGQKYAAICDSLVTAGVPKIIELLLSYKTPGQICQLIGMCDGVENIEDDGIKCAACKYLVGAIEGWVEEDNTVEQIEARLDMLCKVLGSKYEAICDNFVLTGIPMIIQYIEQSEDAEEVCLQIGMCTAVIAESPLVCEGCRYVMGVVEGWVEEQKSVAEIETLLDMFCKIAGKGYEGVCDNLMAEGVEYLLQLLEEYETPEMVCEQLKICSASAAVEANGIECSACQVVVGLVEGWIEKNMTVAEIEQKLESACSFLKAYSSICDTIIEVGIAKIIEYVEQNEDPETVCTQIGLCGSSVKVIEAIRA